MLEILLKKQKKVKNQKGFTLVELIVVIAILGILAAFAIPKVAGFSDSAKKQRVLTEHKMLVSAIQMYQADKGLDEFPTKLSDLDAYVEGKTAKLAERKTVKDSIRSAHVINGTRLTSQFDVEEELVYPIPETP